MSAIDDVIKILENCSLHGAREINSPGKYQFSIGFGYEREGYDEISKRMDSLNLIKEPRRIGVKYRGSGFEVTFVKPNFRQSPISWSHGSSPVFLLLGGVYLNIYEGFRQKIKDRS